MKLLVLISALFLSFAAFSSQKMTKKEQEKYVKKVAKELRRSLWVRGYEDVTSNSVFVTKEILNKHVRDENNSSYEESLDSDQIADLYRCYYKSHCRLYGVFVSSSYQSGYGEDAHFILLNVDRRSHDMVEHTIYAE